MKIYLALLVFTPLVTHAQALPELSTYFGQKVSSVQKGLSAAPLADSDLAFQLQDFYFEVAPEVTFGLNGFVSLTIAPEMDFVLTPVAK